MQFLVDRASLWDDEKQPCPEAKRKPYDAYTYYTFKSVDEANKKYPDLKFEKLVGVRGVRSQRVGAQGWFIDIGSLDDLVTFIGRHGRIIIGPHWTNNNQTAIKIYDDYVE